MVSNHYTISVPLNGVDFAFQDLVLNETASSYNLPRVVNFSNNSEHNMIVKLMSKSEEEGDSFTGIFLKAGEQASFKDVGMTYKVGVRFQSVQSGAGECVVSCFHYNHVEVTP